MRRGVGGREGGEEGNGVWLFTVHVKCITTIELQRRTGAGGFLAAWPLITPRKKSPSRFRRVGMSISRAEFSDGSYPCASVIDCLRCCLDMFNCVLADVLRVERCIARVYKDRSFMHEVLARRGDGAQDARLPNRNDF